MIAVKNAFAAGLEQAGKGQEPPFAFYAACVDYLVFSLGRFHAQGRANTRRLRPLVGDAAEDLAVLEDVEAMLAQSEDQIARLQAAMARYARDPEKGRQAFEEAGRAYIAFYGTHFARRKDPAQQIIAKHFTDEEYWRLTNDFTPQSIATEKRLYAAVKAAAPRGISLD